MTDRYDEQQRPTANYRQQRPTATTHSNHPQQRPTATTHSNDPQQRPTAMPHSNRSRPWTFTATTHSNGPHQRPKAIIKQYLPAGTHSKWALETNRAHGVHTEHPCGTFKLVHCVSRRHTLRSYCQFHLVLACPYCQPIVQVCDLW